MKKIVIGLLTASLVQFVHGEEVTIPVINDLTSNLPPDVIGYEASRPYICVRLTPGSPEGPTKFVIPPGGKATLTGGTNPYWYDASVRLNGCREKDEIDPSTGEVVHPADSYVGYLGIGKQDGRNEIPLKNNLSFTSSERMTIDAPKKYGHTDAISGTLAYIPIPKNLDDSELTPDKAKNRKLTYVGINLSGAEFGKTISANSVPNLSKNAKAGSDLADVKRYIAAGINTVRLPISWGYLELLKAGSTIERPVWIWNTHYWRDLIAPTLATLTHHQVYTIVDLHSYLHYSQIGTERAGCLKKNEKCPDGTLVLDKTPYLKVWEDILTNIRANSNIKEEYLMFDLVNEPAGNKVAGYTIETVTPQDAFDVQVPIVVKLKLMNFKGKILIEGANWTGLHSWAERVDNAPSNAEVFTRAKLEAKLDAKGLNLNNVFINVHQYFDDDFSGTKDVCLKTLKSEGLEKKKFNTDEFAAWLKDQKLKAIVTEFGASNKKGKDIDGEKSCQPILKQFVTEYLANHAVNENKDDGGFVGATLWATGHDWDNYNLLFGPDTYQFKTFIDGLIEK